MREARISPTGVDIYGGWWSLKNMISDELLKLITADVDGRLSASLQKVRNNRPAT